MNPIITTICPYWNRPDQLRVYLDEMYRASIPEAYHIVIFGDPEEFHNWTPPSNRFRFLTYQPKTRSIGSFHNFGAIVSSSDWIMKSDVDVSVTKDIFTRLVECVSEAEPREWLNVGFGYGSEAPRPGRTSDRLGFQFVCRVKDYINMGGCDDGFQGWGWEDYYQMFMLEMHYKGSNPLSGEINIGNVSQRCRDEIARPKALEFGLYARHRNHPKQTETSYRTVAQSEANKELLLKLIKECR